MQILNEIRHDLEQNLSAKRYSHTIGVMYTAAALAMRYNEDMNKAMLAGLLHDCAKQLSLEDMLDLCANQNILLSDFEKNSPELLHSKAGAVLAKTKYNVADSDILEAISYHTTGRPNMSTLDKIIFLADYIEPNRKIIPGLEVTRTLTFTNLDSGLLSALEHSLDYLKSKQIDIDTMTIQTYQYYKNKE